MIQYCYYFECIYKSMLIWWIVSGEVVFQNLIKTFNYIDIAIVLYAGMVWSARGWGGVPTDLTDSDQVGHSWPTGSFMTNWVIHDQLGHLRPTCLFLTNFFTNFDQLVTFNPLLVNFVHFFTNFVNFLLILTSWSFLTPCWSLFGHFLFWNCIKLIEIG